MRIFTLFICLLFVAPGAFAQKSSFLKRIFSLRRPVEVPVKVPPSALPKALSSALTARPAAVAPLLRAPVVSALTPEIRAVVAQHK